jgi:P27 family predicted phage terminase small subunit
MTRPTPAVRAPRHLSAASRKLYADIQRSYELEPHHDAILTKALEALDRADQARDEIGAGPLTVTSRLGEVKPHPLLAVERDARGQFNTLMKALGLDIEGPPPPSARRPR